MKILKKEVSEIKGKASFVVGCEFCLVGWLVGRYKLEAF